MGWSAKSVSLASLCCASLCAQTPATEPATQAPAIQPGQRNVSIQPRTPLTVREKYHLALTRSIEPAEIGRIAMGAALDQWRNYPEEWGQGWDAFGVRMASGFGQHLIKEHIEFGVWAIDHEDPRHQRSGLHGIWPRARYAIIHTFVARRDDGGSMPAYGRFVGDYGAGFISREWYPTRFHNVQQGIDAGSVSLGIDVGMSVLREFVPGRFVR